VFSELCDPCEGCRSCKRGAFRSPRQLKLFPPSSEEYAAVVQIVLPRNWLGARFGKQIGRAVAKRQLESLLEIFGQQKRRPEGPQPHLKIGR